MRHLILYAHPNPGSFNHAILDHFSSTLKETGHEVRVRDLYVLGFDPVLSAPDLAELGNPTTDAAIRAEQEHVLWADVLTFIFPLWWAGMPAILKGYYDRVIANGFAYRFTEKGLEKLLTHKKALTITTLGDSEESYRKLRLIESMDRLWDEVVFAFPGFHVLGHVYFGSVPTAGDAGRKEMLQKVDALARSLGA